MAVKITREFAPADRYVYDGGICSYKNGFAQVDSAQDASYYGTWASPTKRAIVNYCEGDVTLTQCDTDEEFAAEMRRLAEWSEQFSSKRYSNGYAIGIDPGFSEAMKADFERIGLGDLLH